MNTVYVFLGLTVLFLIIEALGPGLVSIWFAAGAAVAILPAALKAPLYVQILTFVVVSAACLLLTRPLVKKYVNSKKQATNADALIGKECLVVEKVDNILGTGAVKVGGKIWSAVSSDEQTTIEEGTFAKVLEIRGVKLLIEKKEEEK